MTARSKERGNAAKAEIGNVAPDLRVEQLDLSDDQSVAATANKIKQYHGGIDILISNAAARIYKEKTPAEQVRSFINTNNHGTYRVLKSFLPLLKYNARVLIVASAFGSLTHLSEELHSKFDVTSNSLDEIEALMGDYVEAVEQGKAFESGWPEWINVPSKVGQVATAKIASKIISEGRPNDGILINAVCPGLVDTEASRPWFDDMSSAKAPDEAAVDLIWLATLPPRYNESTRRVGSIPTSIPLISSQPIFNQQITSNRVTFGHSLKSITALLKFALISELKPLRAADPDSTDLCFFNRGRGKQGNLF